jgi:epoxyqueuosine reductase QueG
MIDLAHGRLNSIRASVAPLGLNHIGVMSVEAYDAGARAELQSAHLCPGARSVVVMASGGPALWHAFVDWLKADPGRLARQAHPLDSFVQTAKTRAAPVLGDADHQWFFAAAEARVHLDFRTMAVAAGLGAGSRLGLVLHPVYGPWIGLRAALFLDWELEATASAAESCENCDAPCVAQCPGDAFVEGQWSVGRCADFHRVSTRCAQSCDARLACPVGADQVYPPLERLYHYDRAAGRVALRTEVGLPLGADRFEGIGPHWGDWAESSGDP